jgi:hypothetical protein
LRTESNEYLDTTERTLHNSQTTPCAVWLTYGLADVSNLFLFIEHSVHVNLAESKRLEQMVGIG